VQRFSAERLECRKSSRTTLSCLPSRSSLRLLLQVGSALLRRSDGFPAESPPQDDRAPPTQAATVSGFDCFGVDSVAAGRG
jgi:hypothetical protein